MAFKPIKMQASKDPAPGEWRLDSVNGGVVYTNLPMEIADNQSPNMSNLWFKERVLTKRYGQEYLFSSIGSFPILSICNQEFNGKVIFTASTNMYSLDLTINTPTVIYSSLTAAKGSFFVFKNILYYINGNQYVQYDGTTVTPVVGYIPLVITGRNPSQGGGTPNEQYNLLSAGFKNSFSADGTSPFFTLTQANLDTTAITATIFGVAKVEGTDFTVNRPTGTVTFINSSGIPTAPIAGTDNVVITAYKTVVPSTDPAVTVETAASIYACKYATTFGGNNDSRVFLAGDSTTYYYSGLNDPTFWPEDQYNNAGVDSTKITGFGKQYDFLVVFKERSMYAVTYSFNGNTASFPMTPLNDSVGCDMPYTIQSINSILTWCNTVSGVQALTSTWDKTEKGVAPLSLNINGTLQNPGLLNCATADLQAATSMDFFGMYWLCVGNQVWVWDYTITPFNNTGNQYTDQIKLSWFPQTNINANCWFGVGTALYYGDRTNGQFIQFVNNYSDFGTAINAYWRSKTLDFDKFDWTKVILDVRARTKSAIYTAITTTYFYDNGSRIDPTIDIVDSFNWATFRWDTFSWAVASVALTITKKPKIKGTVHFSVMFSNDVDGNDLSILDLAILFMLYRRTK